MRFREVVLPPILLIVTFVQVSSFAFGPTIKWNDGVEERASTAQHFVLLDLDIVAVDKNWIFWAYAYFTAAAMFVFLFAELTGLYEKFDNWERSLQNEKEYRDEHESSSNCKPYHFAKNILQSCQWVLGLMIYAASTFLVAPLAKTCAKIFDCVETNGTAVESGMEKYITVVQSNPTMECWTSEHKKIALLTAVLFPLFLLGLAPYVVVVGDPSYVQRAELLAPRNWVENWSASAARKATVLNQGLWHPNPRFIFRNNMVEFLSKASIPFISVLLSHRPVVQMELMSIVGFIMLLVDFLYEPRTEPVCSVLVFGLRLLTFLMMLIGLSVAILNDPNRSEPLWALVCVSVLVPAWMIWRIIKHAKSLKTHVTWKSIAAPGTLRGESESVPLLPTTP